MSNTYKKIYNRTIDLPVIPFEGITDSSSAYYVVLEKNYIPVDSVVVTKYKPDWVTKVDVNPSEDKEYNLLKLCVDENKESARREGYIKLSHTSTLTTSNILDNILYAHVIQSPAIIPDPEYNLIFKVNNLPDIEISSETQPVTFTYYLIPLNEDVVEKVFKLCNLYINVDESQPYDITYENSYYKKLDKNRILRDKITSNGCEVLYLFKNTDIAKLYTFLCEYIADISTNNRYATVNVKKNAEVIVIICETNKKTIGQDGDIVNITYSCKYNGKDVSQSAKLTISSDFDTSYRYIGTPLYSNGKCVLKIQFYGNKSLDDNTITVKASYKGKDASCNITLEKSTVTFVCNVYDEDNNLLSSPYEIESKDGLSHTYTIKYYTYVNGDEDNKITTVYYNNVAYTLAVNIDGGDYITIEGPKEKDKVYTIVIKTIEFDEPTEEDLISKIDIALKNENGDVLSVPERGSNEEVIDVTLSISADDFITSYYDTDTFDSSILGGLEGIPVMLTFVTTLANKPIENGKDDIVVTLYIDDGKEVTEEDGIVYSYNFDKRNPRNLIVTIENNEKGIWGPQEYETQCFNIEIGIQYKNFPENRGENCITIIKKPYFIDNTSISAEPLNVSGNKGVTSTVEYSANAYNYEGSKLFVPINDLRKHKDNLISIDFEGIHNFVKMDGVTIYPDKYTRVITFEENILPPVVDDEDEQTGDRTVTLFLYVNKEKTELSVTITLSIANITVVLEDSDSSTGCNMTPFNTGKDYAIVLYGTAKNDDDILYNITSLDAIKFLYKSNRKDRENNDKQSENIVDIYPADTSIILSDDKKTVLLTITLKDPYFLLGSETISVNMVYTYNDHEYTSNVYKINKPNVYTVYPDKDSNGDIIIKTWEPERSNPLQPPDDLFKDMNDVGMIALLYYSNINGQNSTYFLRSEKDMDHKVFVAYIPGKTSTRINIYSGVYYLYMPDAEQYPIVCYDNDSSHYTYTYNQFTNELTYLERDVIYNNGYISFNIPYDLTTSDIETISYLLDGLITYDCSTPYYNYTSTGRHYKILFKDIVTVSISFKTDKIETVYSQSSLIDTISMYITILVNSITLNISKEEINSNIIIQVSEDEGQNYNDIESDYITFASNSKKNCKITNIQNGVTARTLYFKCIYTGGIDSYESNVIVLTLTGENISDITQWITEPKNINAYYLNSNDYIQSVEYYVMNKSNNSIIRGQTQELIVRYNDTPVDINDNDVSTNGDGKNIYTYIFSENRSVNNTNKLVVTSKYSAVPGVSDVLTTITQAKGYLEINVTETEKGQDTILRNKQYVIYKISPTINGTVDPVCLNGTSIQSEYEYALLQDDETSKYIKITAPYAPEVDINASFLVSYTEGEYKQNVVEQEHTFNSVSVECFLETQDSNDVLIPTGGNYSILFGGKVNNLYTSDGTLTLFIDGVDVTKKANSALNNTYTYTEPYSMNDTSDIKNIMCILTFLYYGRTVSDSLTFKLEPGSYGVVVEVYNNIKEEIYEYDIDYTGDIIIKYYGLIGSSVITDTSKVSLSITNACLTLVSLEVKADGIYATYKLDDTHNYKGCWVTAEYKGKESSKEITICEYEVYIDITGGLSFIDGASNGTISIEYYGTLTKSGKDISYITDTDDVTLTYETNDWLTPNTSNIDDEKLLQIFNYSVNNTGAERTCTFTATYHGKTKLVTITLLKSTEYNVFIDVNTPYLKVEDTSVVVTYYATSTQYRRNSDTGEYETSISYITDPTKVSLECIKPDDGTSIKNISQGGEPTQDTINNCIKSTWVFDENVGEGGDIERKAMFKVSYNGKEDSTTVTLVGKGLFVASPFSFLVIKYGIAGEKVPSKINSTLFTANDIDSYNKAAGTDLDICVLIYPISNNNKDIYIQLDYDEPEKKSDNHKYVPLTLLTAGFSQKVQPGKNNQPGSNMTYFKWSGDNLSSEGYESVFISWRDIIKDRDLISKGFTTLQCRLYGHWYQTKLNGAVNIEYLTYGNDPKNDTINNLLIKDFVYTLDNEKVDNDKQLTYAVNKSGSSGISIYSSDIVDEPLDNLNINISRFDILLQYYTLMAVLEYDIKSGAAKLNKDMVKNIPSYIKNRIDYKPISGDRFVLPPGYILNSAPIVGNDVAIFTNKGVPQHKMYSYLINITVTSTTATIISDDGILYMKNMIYREFNESAEEFKDIITEFKNVPTLSKASIIYDNYKNIEKDDIINAFICNNDGNIFINVPLLREHFDGTNTYTCELYIMYDELPGDLFKITIGVKS